MSTGQSGSSGDRKVIATVQWPRGADLVKKWLCAATAASLAETVTMPLDVAKVRLQLQRSIGNNSGNKGMLRTIASVHRHEGFRALYTGLTAAVLRQTLCGGIGVGLYHPVKELLCGPNFVGPVPLHLKIVAASSTGVLGQIIAAPTDVVKVRLQGDIRSRLSGSQAPARYPGGTFATFGTIARQEGIGALYRVWYHHCNVLLLCMVLQPQLMIMQSNLLLLILIYALILCGHMWLLHVFRVWLHPPYQLRST